MFIITMFFRQIYVVDETSVNPDKTSRFGGSVLFGNYSFGGRQIKMG